MLILKYKKTQARSLELILMLNIFLDVNNIIGNSNTDQCYIF